MALGAFVVSAFPATLFNVKFAVNAGVAFLQLGISCQGGAAFGAGVGFGEFVVLCSVLIMPREFDGVIHLAVVVTLPAVAGEPEGVRHSAEFVVPVRQGETVCLEVLEFFGESGDAVGGKPVALGDPIEGVKLVCCSLCQQYSTKIRAMSISELHEKRCKTLWVFTRCFVQFGVV